MAQTKPKKRKKQGQAPMTKKAKAKGLKASNGENERLAHFKLRAITLRTEGCTLEETAEAITKEFDLERIPSSSTIIRWCGDQILSLNQEYERIAIAHRLNQDAQIDEMMRQLWPIVTGGHGLRIQHWKQTAEGPEPFIDEQAYDEWLKAYDRFLKLMDRRAKLWNIDLAKVTVDTGEGPKSLQELQLWINQTIIYGDQKQMKGSEVLSLEAGIPNVSIV